MAFSFDKFLPLFLFCMLAAAAAAVHGQYLSPNFYASSCPDLESIVQSEMMKADIRKGAQLLRVFFHDCFVNGCDASVLLDDLPGIAGEKNAVPNKDSLRGYEVIDAIKARVEAACPATVSCADILALAARDGTVRLGGPSWTVALGRRDARKAADPNTVLDNLPSPFDDLEKLIRRFVSKGFSAQDMTILSGAHTVGVARCDAFRDHIYGRDGVAVDAGFAASVKQRCPEVGGDGNLSPLDYQSPGAFDNLYYQNLVMKKGLLRSDQELFNGGSQDSVVMTYSTNAMAWRTDFAKAMEKMGSMSPMTGMSGEIRMSCGRANSPY